MSSVCCASCDCFVFIKEKFCFSTGFQWPFIFCFDICSRSKPVADHKPAEIMPVRVTDFGPTKPKLAPYPAPISLKHVQNNQNDTPKGSRTPVFGLRTRCPRPLDDGGVADLPDGTGYHWPFQVLRPKVPETSLPIWPSTSRRPPARRRQTSSSKKKTDSKTKCCKRTCYCPHSSRNNLVNLFSVN